MPCNAPKLLNTGSVTSLAVHYLRYDPVYDEVFNEVHRRLKANGFASKLDLGALVFWKHVRNAPWMRTLNLLPETRVRAATTAAFAPGLTDAGRIAALNPLQGFRAGGAFTSVLLTAWNPNEYGVFDELAHGAIARYFDARCTCDLTDLPAYFDHLRTAATEISTCKSSLWTPKMVDMALYKAGGGP